MMTAKAGTLNAPTGCLSNASVTAFFAAASPMPPALQARVTQEIAPLAQLPTLQARASLQQEDLPGLQARIARQLQDLPTLQARIDNRPPLAQQARGAAGGDTIHYNITIHAAPGTDGQDLSRMVRDEIERLDRQRNIRKRSQLSDYDSY